MKTYFTILSIFLFFTIAHSQQFIKEVEPPQMEINVSLGLSIPSAPTEFSDIWDPGFNGGIGFEMPVVSVFHLTANVEYNNFSLDKNALLRKAGATGSGIELSGGSANIYTISGNAKLLLSNSTQSVVPYVTAGVGYFHLSFEDLKLSYSYLIETIKSESQSELSALFALGINIPFEGVNRGAFVEAKYVHGFTENEETKYYIIKGGIRFFIG
jgi:hypothetical protein